MFYVLQNDSTAARRRVPILLTDAATGTTAQSGVALTTIFPYVNINGGAFIGGTGSLGEADFGQYYYEMEINETATLGLAGIHITAAGCRNYDAIAQISAFNMYSNTGLGLTAGDVWSYDISGITAAGSAGTQLNLAASGGGPSLTAAEVWDYNGTTNPATVKETLELAKQYADTAQGQTGPTSIRDAVWDTDVSFVTSPNAGYQLYQAAYGTTSNAPDQVWSYATRTLTSGGAGLTVGDVSDAVWNAQVGSYATSGSFGLNILRSDLAGIAGSVTVWSGAAYNGVYADAYRIDASYTAATALKDVLTGIGSSITGNITGNLSGSVGFIVDDVTLSAGTQASIANSVWSTDISGYTSPSAGFDLANASSGAGLTAGDVWDYDLSAYNTLGNSAGSYLFFNTDKIFSNLDIPSSAIAASTWSYVTRTLTSAATGLTAGDVWTYGSRTITGGLADTVTTLTNRSGFAITGGTITTVLDKTGYSLSGTQSFNLTGNITGNVSGSVGSVTAAVTVANASMTGIAGTVWNSLIASYGTNGTFGKLVLRSDAANKTGDVTLYSSGGVNGVDADIHRIANDTAAATAWKNILTGIGASITSNITGSVSGSVGSVSGSVGSVVAAVSLSGATQSSIANTVWSTNISSYSAGTAGNTLLNAGGGGVAITAGDIWTYFDRTLTSSTGATAGDVWTYVDRTLTSGAGITVIGAVQLVNGPYRLTSNQNNNDGILDILQNSVQEINLNLIDGNGAPASTAGYATVVNFFNEAGTAVTSYVPTVEYADGGVLTFEIDGAVTATTGRYNLIVNLSGAGFLVKYGPLTTLVRPL